MPLLEVKNLDKAFVSGGRSITAIDQLSLSIEEHEFVSIVGPSGCGKSTFLHIVGGFEPATAGELRLNGRPIGPPGPDRGMMFQDLSLFPWLTAIENVAWPLEMKGLAKAERRKKAGEYLDLVHLSRYGDLYPGQLSGGMKQRVALARLFALAAARGAGLVACEPRRGPFALWASHLVFALGANAVSRHDAVASVRAGFAGRELSALWPKAGWELTERRALPFSHIFTTQHHGT